MSIAVPEYLYHGSIVRFLRPEVRKGRGFKDFGRGFYMSVDPRQAIGMMHKKCVEANGLRGLVDIAEPQETLYRIALDRKVLDGLNVKVFEQADAEWLDFILACRRTEGGVHSYDVVVGPTADDDTRLLIKNYLDGVYGDLFDPESKATLLRLLNPERLGVQWYVRTQSVADRLIAEFRPVDWRGFA